MDIVTTYARQWRFEVSLEKSEVMLFGGSKYLKLSSRDYPFRIGGAVKDDVIGPDGNKVIGKLVKFVPSYVYLGLNFTSNFSIVNLVVNRIKKGKHAMHAALGMGMGSGLLTVKASLKIWDAIIRPHFEYGAEIWGSFGVIEEIEIIKRQVGRKILRGSTGKTLSNDVIYLELGWWRQVARWDFLRLCWLYDLELMPESRLLGRFYRESIYRAAQVHNDNIRGTPWYKQTWFVYTYKLLLELDIINEFDKIKNKTITKHEWRSVVKQKIHEREKIIRINSLLKGEIKLKTKINIKPLNQKLAIFRNIWENNNNKPFSLQRYLINSSFNYLEKLGSRIMLSLRSGGSFLELERGRYDNIKRELRICKVCDLDVVETEDHFVFHCSYYQRERILFFQELISSSLIFQLAKIDISTIINYFINPLYPYDNNFENKMSFLNNLLLFLLGEPNNGILNDRNNTYDYYNLFIPKVKLFLANCYIKRSHFYKNLDK